MPSENENDFVDEILSIPIPDLIDQRIQVPIRRRMNISNESHFFFNNILNPFSATEAEAVPPVSNMMDNAHEMRLSKATDQVINESRIYRDREDLDRRERDYLSIIRNEKNEAVTTMDLITSEFPVYLGELTNSKLKAIYDSGSVRGAVTHENDRRAICSKCGLDTPIQYAFLTNARIYCSEHVPHFKMCAICNSLKDDTKSVKTFDDRDLYVCKGCIQARSTRGCRACGNQYPIEYIELQRCENHIDSGERSGYREFSKGLKWVVRQKGEIVKSTRMFSAEIEALVDRNKCIDIISQTIPSECGLGSDSSVSGEGLHGFELQTPRLAGRKGEECLWRIGASLKKVVATVNLTCGMHIHLDGKGIINPNRRLYPKALIQLWKAYIVFEDVVLSVIPYERRSTSYARPLREAFKLSELEACETQLDCERLWYKERYWQQIQSNKAQHHHTTRYFGVNLHPLLGFGHMEIRYHSGTTNPTKILQWVNLHALIMDAAAEGKFTRAFLKEAQATSALKDKTDLLFEMLEMTEGSKQYFYARQNKFTKKSNNESHIA